MLFQQMNHHLIFMLNRHIDEYYKEHGFESVISPPELKLNTKNGTQSVTPSLAVFGPGSRELPLLVADVDTQSCGPQKNFTDKINWYSEAGVRESWIFYTKDHLIIVRRQEENGFGKHKVYSESDMLVPDGLFPLFKDSVKR